NVGLNAAPAVAYYASDDTECEYDEYIEYCGTDTGGVECSYNRGAWVREYHCTCNMDRMAFIWGRGCVCEAGTYGDTHSGCTACPGSGWSTEGSNGDITNCYLRSGTGGSDATGKWQYASNCPYKQ
ncbi:hypothetical protein HDR63_01230, partial [bacterium]|nr:hypothetical protein [bacterium]